MALNTPVLLLVFNRPEVTNQVFEKIRQVRPKKLYLAADGPRKGYIDDRDKCRKVKKIIENVDWDCEVKRLYRNKNFGCGLGPATAISWFFDNEEEGIILEDDCLPNRSFFYFCEELLKKYRCNNKIMLISGNNYQFGKARGKSSYYFSKIPHTWGWSTWKRSWDKYNFEMKTYSEFKRNNSIKLVFDDVRMQKYWLKRYDMVEDGKRKDIWDYQWFYTIMSSGGLSITPNCNLVKNIGHNKNATHTYGKTIISEVDQKDFIKLDHPKKIKPHTEADLYFYNRVLEPNGWYLLLNGVTILRNYTFEWIKKYVRI